MNTASKVLVVAVVLCAMTMVGCQKKMQLTIVNHTGSVLPVSVTTPEAGTVNVGSVGANGSSIRHTIRIKEDDLPASCSVRVGLVSRSFTVNEDMKDKQWFHYDDKGLAGPMDKDTPYVTEKQTGEIRLRTEPRTIVE